MAVAALLTSSGTARSSWRAPQRAAPAHVAHGLSCGHLPAEAQPLAALSITVDRSQHGGAVNTEATQFSAVGRPIG